MSTRYLSIPARLLHRRLNRVGIVGRQLFVHPNSDTSIEIWQVDSIFPDSWQCLLNLPAATVIYSIPAFSYDLPYILVFFGGVLEEEDNFEILIYRLNYETKEVKKFRLDPSRCLPANNTFDLPLETVSLRIGAKMQCCLFDRSIVQGPIPYWRLDFDEQNDVFWFERDDIKARDVRDADSETDRLQCSRFSIAFDAPGRIFGRLQDDGSMMIYNAQLEKWLQYSLENSSTFDLPPTTVRGLRESYGRNGRRVGAVESPLTFHPDSNGICIVKLVKNDHRHYFYRMQLDHSSQTFSCSPRGSVHLEKGVEKMFYTLCSEDIFVFLGIRTIAVVSLQPFRLQDSAIWRLQKFLNGNFLRKEQVKELCKIVYRNLS